MYNTNKEKMPGMRTKAPRKNNMKKLPKPAFAKAVMAVVNKKSERKMYARDFNYTGLSYGLTNSWNITQGLAQGPATNQRIGDKVYVNKLRLSGVIVNTNSAGTQYNNNGGIVRIVVFRGKYDYTAASYPIAELLESSGGSVGTAPYVAQRVDLNQVGLVADWKVRIPPNQIQNQVQKIMFDKVITINSSFKYREDDSYGKYHSLYVAFITEPGVQLSDSISVGANLSFTYTDV